MSHVKPVRLKPGGVALLLSFAAIAFVANDWFNPSVLPPLRKLRHMPTPQLRRLVLAYLPLGTDSIEVDRCLKEEFRRTRYVYDMGQIPVWGHGFSVEVTENDHC